MHYSLLVLLDGSKTLGELMDPYDEDKAYDESRNDDAMWDWYEVGGRWKGLIEATIGGFGRRNRWDFEKDNEPYPGDGFRFDIARVCDITNLDTNMIHDVLTPDGIWHKSEIYYPDGNEEGQYFVTKDGWHDSVWDKYVKPHSDCLAMIIDYHI